MASSSGAASPAAADRLAGTSHFDLALLEKALPSAASTAAEVYPLVTLVHPNGEAKTGHVALAADLHFLNSSFPLEKEPSSLVEFGGRRAQHFAVQRLEDERLPGKVGDPLKRVHMHGKHGVQFRAVCLQRSIRNKLQGLVQNDKPESCFVYTVLADTEEMADSLREGLELHVLSWAALEERMRDARRQFEQQSLEGGEQSAGPSMPEPSHNGVEHIEHATMDKVLQVAAKANAGASWGSTVTAGVAALASGAEMSNALARSLGGVSFVGPALQLAAFITRAADVVVKANSVHKDLIPVYARLHHGMRQIVGVACRVGHGHPEGDAVVRKLFGSLRVCWGLMQRTERVILGGVGDKVRNWNAVAEFRSDLDELEKHLDSLHALTYTTMLEGKISGLQKDVADQNERLSRSEDVSNRNQASADSFVASYASVPPKHRLQRFVASALPKLGGVKSKLRRTGSVAVTGAGSTVVVGQGGVGKTTACVAVCHADDVRIVFEDGMYFFEFDLLASNADVADMLCSAVRESGGYTTADRMERKFEKNCGKKDPIIPLVREAREWFAGRSALFVFDNVYFRETANRGAREWLSVLIDIVGSAPESAVLVSTRARTLVNEVVGSRVEFGVLDGALANEEQAAIDLINEYASDKFGEPLMPLVDQKQHALGEEQDHACSKILGICGGLQLAICIAGNMVLRSKGDWVGVCSSLEKTDDALLNDEIDTVTHHAGLSRVMTVSLEVLDDKDKDRGRFEGYTQSDLRGIYGDKCFARLYARFGLLESASSVPVEVVHALFGGKDSGTAGAVKAVALFFEEFGLITVRAETHSQLVIELHDMEHSFSKLLLRRSGGRGSVKFGPAHEHRAFMKKTAMTLICDKEFGAEIDWSRLWDESGEYWRIARSYVKSNLIRHMLEGASDVDRTGECCCGESSCCVPSVGLVRKCLVALFCDFRWIRARALRDGRSALLGDFTRVLRAQAHGLGGVVRAEGAEDDFGEECGEPVLQDGEFAAIEHIYRLCCLVHSTCLEARGWRCQEHVSEGGDMATGILRGIDGDDVFGSDDRLDDDGKRVAQEVLSRLAESIRVNVKGPYLRLLRPFVGSVVEGMAKGAVREFQWGLSACDSLLSLPETFGILSYQGSTGKLCVRDMRNLSAAPEILVFDMAIRGVACTTAFGETRTNFAAAVTETCVATVWRINLGVDEVRDSTCYATLERGRALSLHIGESATCVAVSKGARVVAVGTDKGKIVLSHKAASCENGKNAFKPGARIDLFGGAVRSLHLPHDEPWALGLLQSGDLKRWCVDEDVRLSLGSESSAVSCVGRNIWAVELVGDSRAYTVERGTEIVTKANIATEHSTALIQVSQGCSDITSLAVLGGRESAMVVCVGRRDGRVECWTDFGGERECVLGISVDTGSEVVSTALLWRQAGGMSGRSRRVFDVVSTHLDMLCRVSTGVVLADGSTALWDDVREREVSHLSTGDGRGEKAVCNGVKYLAASARVGVVVSGHQGGFLRMWDVRTGALRMQMKAYSEVVRCVDVSGDGSVAVLGGSDNHVRVWELGASSGERHVLSGHEHAVSRVFLCHGAQRAVSCDEAGFLRLRDIECGTCSDMVSPIVDRGRRLVSDIRRLVSDIRSFASDPSNNADEKAVAGERLYCTDNLKTLFVAVHDRLEEIASSAHQSWVQHKKVHPGRHRDGTRSEGALLCGWIRSEIQNVRLARTASAPLTAQSDRLHKAVTTELTGVLSGIISLKSRAIACGCSPRDAVLRNAADPRLAASSGFSKRGSLRIYEVVNYASDSQSPSDTCAERRRYASNGNHDQICGSSGSACHRREIPDHSARVSPGDDGLLQQQMEKTESKAKAYLERLEKNVCMDRAEKCVVTHTIQSMWVPWRSDPARLSMEFRAKFGGSGIIGHGGHGIVYKGLLREPEVQRSIRVAVKVLHKKFSGVDMKMDFFREASLLHALRHPCILKFYGAVWPSETTVTGRVSEALWESSSDSNSIRANEGWGGNGEPCERDSTYAMLVTERMTCTAMDAKRGGVLCSHDRVWQVLVDVAEALEYVHGCGVLHLDVKADNVLLCVNKKGNCIEGRARLSGFGVSRRKRSTSSVISRFFRSTSKKVYRDVPKVRVSAYVPPELMAGAVARDESYRSQSATKAGKICGACDVWSFGVLVCVLGCRSTENGVLEMSKMQVVSHFEDGTLLGKCMKSVSELEKLNEPLAAIAAMCLREDASKRPTIAEVRLALHREAREGSKVTVSEVACSGGVIRGSASASHEIPRKGEKNVTAEDYSIFTKSELSVTDTARMEDDLTDEKTIPWAHSGGYFGYSFGAIEDTPSLMCRDGCRIAHDHATNAARIRKLAKARNADGQVDYGHAPAFGRGVDQSDVKAVRCISAAAEQGDANSQNDLGLMYRDGRGVGRDYAEAAHWFRKAVEAGNADGQVNYGCALELGQGVGQSDVEAAKWYSAAAEQGNATGQSKLGRMYRDGRGLRRDHAKAAEWFRKSAEAGNARGQVSYGRAFEYGQGVSQSDVEAVKWYSAAAEQENAEAQDSLGVMYRNGRGVNRDYAKAAEMFRKSAEAGIAYAQVNYGSAFKYGQGVGQSDEEAAKWYSAATEQGDAEACDNMGIMYRDGRGVERDYAKAAELFRKSAEAGNARGQVSYGRAFEYGQGVGQSDVEAVKWYSTSAEQGNAAGQKALGIMYSNGRGVLRDLAKARDLFCRSRKADDTDGQSDFLRLQEREGVQRNDAGVRKILRRLRKS